MKWTDRDEYKNEVINLPIVEIGVCACVRVYVWVCVFNEWMGDGDIRDGRTL